MTAIGTIPVLFATGDHSSRPAASAPGKGGLYSCTTHGLIYQTDGSSWTTWATLGAAASGSITASGYTQSTAKMLGRSTASTGAIEEITVGSGLSLSGGSLSATGGGLSSGTSFPGSPSSGDLFFRTDRGLLYYYDGTRWLTVQQHSLSFPPTDKFQTWTTGASNAGRLPIPWGGVYQLYVTAFDWFMIPTSAHSSSNYWTCKLNWADAADSDTLLGSTLDSKTATTGSNNYNFREDIGTVLSTNAREFKFRIDKVASGADIIYTTAVVHYRLIG